MDEQSKVVLRKVHRIFIENLDPNYVMDFLYEIDVFNANICEKLRRIEFRGDRARMFMFLVTSMDTLTMEILYEALRNTGYGFLAEVLRQSSHNSVSVQRKAEYFSRFRKELVVYRHYLKRLSHTGDHATFEEEFFKAEQNWKNIENSGLNNKRYKAADFYFFALDAWCEYRRVIYDKNLMYTDVFDKMENLKPYLSEENLPEMMRLVRYGSAVLMTNKNELNTALDYVNDAKSKFDLIHACRETGTVLYIEYNMLCQKYAQNLEPVLKEQLCNIANKAIEHFAVEIEFDETVYLDFKRMVLLKLSHLLLGIGMFGVYLDVSVSTEDKRKAISFLRLIKETKESWKRMETRWKWSYYTAKARLFGLNNNFPKAIKYTERALCYATKGSYSKEILGSQNALNIYNNLCERKTEFHELEYETTVSCNDNKEDSRMQRHLEQMECEIDYSLRNLEMLENEIKHSKERLLILKEKVKLFRNKRYKDGYQ
ncbi:unnamed protein product [Mytilus coruscus]|uniref:CARD domain-containing protein n=1 Tax=Mytilus coruscus TaxID=42192 RepID=A0A6J8DW26_MYTCO|nr:unnamed protein product [Mytilus coruscus]